MNSRIPILIFLMTISLTAPAFAQQRWGEDRLIGEFDQGLAQIGPGYSHFDCLYGSDADVFVCFIEDSTNGSGDILRVRKSFNNGLTWTYQQTITGGSNAFYGSNIARIPNSNNILVSLVSGPSGGSRVLRIYRYEYNDLGYLGSETADFSYPGAGDPVSCMMVTNDYTEEIWLFAVDDNEWLYLTRSSDGVNWSPSQPVAANVQRPHAEPSADGHVAVVWSHSGTNEIRCAVADQSGTFQPAIMVTDNACPMATPIAGWEHLGDMNLGVVWHCNLGQSYLNLSTDDGQTWGPDQLIGNGYFPYIDHFPGTRRMGVCYTTDTGEVKVASAATLQAVPLQSFNRRSDYEAYVEGPSKVAFGESSGQLALFYLTPSTEEFWFDSSVLSGIEGWGSAGVSVTAGPNPAAGAFTVVPSGFPGAVNCRVFSLDGRTVFQQTGVTGEIQAGSGDMASGIYTVLVEDGVSAATCRVVRF